MDTLPSRYILGRDIQRYRSLKDVVRKLQREHNETLTAIHETHDTLIALNLGRENAVDNVGYENGARLGDRKVLDDLYGKQKVLDARAIKQRKKLSMEEEKLFRARKNSALHELLAEVVSPQDICDDDGETKVNTKPEHRKSTTRKPLQDDERLVDDSNHHTLGYTTEITVGRYPPSRQPSQRSSVRRHPSVWTNCEHRNCSQTSHLRPCSSQSSIIQRLPTPAPSLHRAVSFKDSVSTHSASTLVHSQTSRPDSASTVVDNQASTPAPPVRPFPRTTRRCTAVQHRKPALARQFSFIPGQPDHIAPKKTVTPAVLLPKHCDCCMNSKPVAPPPKQNLQAPDKKLDKHNYTPENARFEVAKATDAPATHHTTDEPFFSTIGKAIFTLFGATVIFNSVWKTLTYSPPPSTPPAHKGWNTSATDHRLPLNGIFREIGNFIFLLFGLTLILGALRSRTG